MSAISDIIANSISDKEALDSIAEYIMRCLRASTYLLDTEENIVSFAAIENKPCFAVADIKKLHTSFIRAKKATVINLLGMDCLIIPLNAISRRFGTLFIYSSTAEYKKEDINELYDAVYSAALLLRCINIGRDINDIKSEETVKAALGSLSFSELNGALTVFSLLKGQKDGVIITSKIAEHCGMTRSVIINALKKLESASIIEIQSLGMKGTHINVLNPYIYKQLKQYKTV